jgi:hypothetical protein
LHFKSPFTMNFHVRRRHCAMKSRSVTGEGALLNRFSDDSHILVLRNGQNRQRTHLNRGMRQWQS